MRAARSTRRLRISMPSSYIAQPLAKVVRPPPGGRGEATGALSPTRGGVWGAGAAGAPGDHHRRRRSRAADVDGAEDELDAAVGVDAAAGARLTAGVAPVAEGDAAAAVLALQLGGVVGVVLHRLHDGEVADDAPLAAEGAVVALFGDVLDAQLHRVDVEHPRQLVDRRVAGEHAGGRAGGAVGAGLRLVADDVVAVDDDVGDVVRREDAVHAAADGRAGGGARCVGEGGLAGGERGGPLGAGP